MAPASGLGITTTLRLPAGGEKPLLSWVRWHLGLGFDHAFLFFDEPRPDGADDAWAPVGAREVRARWAPERVTVVHRTAEQRAWQRARCSAWAEFGPHADDEVQARQVLNAEQAMALALAPGRPAKSRRRHHEEPAQRSHRRPQATHHARPKARQITRTQKVWNRQHP